MFLAKKWLICLVLGLTSWLLMNNNVKAMDLNLEEGQYGIVFMRIPSGEATLIFNKDHNGFLINCGASTSLKEIKKTLDIFHIKQIKHLYITSYDSLYVGNIDELKRENALLKIYDLSMIGDHEKLYIPDFNGLEIDKIPEHLSCSNDFYLRYHRFSIFFQGNLENRKEQAFLQSDYMKSANIIKVGDFGSKDILSKDMIDAMNPQYAVIFDDPNRTPNYTLLKKLFNAWVDLYLLEDSGSFGVITDGETFQPFVLD